MPSLLISSWRPCKISFTASWIAKVSGWCSKASSMQPFFIPISSSRFKCPSSNAPIDKPPPDPIHKTNNQKSEIYDPSYIFPIPKRESVKVGFFFLFKSANPDLDWNRVVDGINHQTNKIRKVLEMPTKILTTTNLPRKKKKVNFAGKLKNFRNEIIRGWEETKGCRWSRKYVDS